MTRLYILGSLVVVTGIAYLSWQQRQQASHRPYRTKNLSIKMRGYVFAVGCFLLASWNIPYGISEQHEQGKGVDIMVMLDVSMSMQVFDMPNQENRLNFSKDLINKLIKKTKQARRGIGIFAGEAQGILPLTNDLNLVNTFLAGLDHQNLTKQGTSLAEAIDLGAQRFDIESHEGNILLILSDGGEESVTVNEQTKKTLKDLGISVIIIGIGSEAGGPIIEGVDLFGNPLVKQWQGAPVISKLQEAQLKEAAKQVNGTYIRGSATSVDRISADIDRLPPKLQEGVTGIHQKTMTTLFIMLGVCGLLVTIFSDVLLLVYEKSKAKINHIY